MNILRETSIRLLGAQTSPVNCLYPELLCFIMQMYLDENRPHGNPDIWWGCEPALLLSHVSSRWRSIALGNRALWSRIFIPFLPTLLDLSKRIDRLETYILRSDPMPLHIYLGDRTQDNDYRSLQELRDLGVEGVAASILSSLLTAKDRWQRFNAPAMFFSYGPISRAIYFPILERIIIRGSEQDIEGPHREFPDADMIMFMDAPKLRYVEDEQVGIQYPWAQLEHVTLRTSDLSYLTGQHVCTNLKTLTLNESLEDDSQAPVFLVLPIERLTIHHPDVLWYLKAPHLTSLKVSSSESWEENQISDFLTLSNCATSLTSLSCHLSRSNIQKFIVLLDYIPDLAYLTICWKPGDHYAAGHCVPLWKGMTHGQQKVLVPQLKSLQFKCPQIFDVNFLAMLRSRLGTELTKVEIKFRRGQWAARPFAVAQEKARKRVETWLPIRDGIIEVSKGGEMEIQIIGDTPRKVGRGPSSYTPYLILLMILLLVYLF